jgi:hypothetical protein
LRFIGCDHAGHRLPARRGYALGNLGLAYANLGEPRRAIELQADTDGARIFGDQL